MTAKTYHIDDRLHGASLAQAVKQLRGPGTSWSDAKRLIANRHVQVHGNLCLDEGRRLKTGDVVKIFDHALTKPPEATDIAILYRDAHLVIVEKPAGVTTQREAREISTGRNQKQATLDELLNQALARLPRERDLSSAGSDPTAQRSGSSEFIVRRREPTSHPRQTTHDKRHSPIRVRPVHRLDRDTSGLMLFALSPQAETKLVQLFKHHTIDRVYRAVVHGRVEGPMRIESDFVRDRGDGLRGTATDATPPDVERQHAVTLITPIESIAGGLYTVVECKLETGRTHQIRIHLAERGHMLCGEQTYTRPRAGEPIVRDASGAPRHALHSWLLSLAHPITDAPLKFESPWPDDLSRWLARIRA